MAPVLPPPASPTVSTTKVRAEIRGVADTYHAAVRDSWSIVDDDERRREVGAAYAAARVELARIRDRFEAKVAARRPTLVRRAFTPFHDQPADRTWFDALVADLADRLVVESDAYTALHEARQRIAEQPHGPLAVFRVAWDRGWSDVVALGRHNADEERAYGRSGIDVLLDFEADVASVRSAAFEVAAPIMLAESATTTRSATDESDCESDCK